MHQAKVEFTQPNPTSNTVHQVTVECTTEASPKAITYWVFKVESSLKYLRTPKSAITYWLSKDVMILRSLRHHTEEEVEGYRLHSRLTIHQVPVNLPLQGLHCASSR